MNASGDTAAFFLEHRHTLEPVDNLPDALYPGSEAAACAARDEVVRGLSLRAGERVSTGTACDIHFARPGDAVCAGFGDPGRVEMRFDASRSAAAS